VLVVSLPLAGAPVKARQAGVAVGDKRPHAKLVGEPHCLAVMAVGRFGRHGEDLHGYTVLLRQVLTTHGVPVALYGDGLNVFVRNDRHWSLDEQLRGAQEPTHFGRMLQELGIGFVQARSPQGKGRVERLWGTLQDRLVSELRLRGIDTSRRPMDSCRPSSPITTGALPGRRRRPAQCGARVRRRPPCC
jgi:hypothetical protein